MALRQIIRTLAGNVFGLDKVGNLVMNRVGTAGRTPSQMVVEDDGFGFPQVTVQSSTGLVQTMCIVIGTSTPSSADGRNPGTIYIQVSST